MMTKRQDVFALAETLGATVDVTGERRFTVTVDAPAGFQWVDGGSHQLVAQAWDAQPASVTWADLLPRMRCGLMPCDDHD
jgi:hypothetical protein